MLTGPGHIRLFTGIFKGQGLGADLRNQWSEIQNRGSTLGHYSSSNMEAVCQTVYERGGLSGTQDARVRQP